ncbi:MAG TPA: DoxX family protein [Pelagibacteraceae bacterium]|jgi:putative oxidoreductase|nr:DoxX family protein [Pelagibacteraceae bacterium]
MHVIDVLGRIFLSTLFLIEGTNKIFNYEETIQYMENFGVPGYLAIPAIILEILFPLLLIIGYQTKIAALVMMIFTIVVAIIFHTNFDDQMQFITFFKDIAIAGGFIIIFVNGAGKFSVDYKLKSNKTNA